MIAALFKCRNVSTVAAEQLLLDMQSLRMVLLELPSIGSAVNTKKAPASYTRFVTAGMSKAELFLKIVMSPHEPPGLFAEDFVRLLGYTFSSLLYFFLTPA